jgi:glycosyltransferase involved in cell wall biosynthesis
VEEPLTRLRIGFDGRWYNRTGVGNYVSELLQAVGALDEDIEVIAYEDERNPLDQVASNKIRKVPLRARKYSVAEQFELADRCRADKINVFHSPFYLVPWFAKCPVVVTIHDLIPFLFKIYSVPKRAMVQAGYRFAARKAAHVIAVSRHTANDISRILDVPDERINVVPLGVSPEFHSVSDDAETERLMEQFGVRQPYALALSAKNWKTKNLSNVLKALSNCRHEVKLSFQTVVAGSKEGLQEASRETAIEMKDVVSTGFVSNSDLAMLYRHAEVFVMGSRYEGFGLPLLEAMSCGCAVVSSNAGSLPEVAGADALLVDPDDVPRMASAVRQILSGPDERDRQKARSRKRAAEFSWERTAKETVSVYWRAVDKA